MKCWIIFMSILIEILVSTYFGFKEVLGSFDSLSGDVDFRETSEFVQTAVLCQLSCCRLPEDQQELRRKNIGTFTQ